MDTQFNSILEIALQQGVWAALYIYLFFRMLKQNETREAQYQSIIKNLNKSILSGIEEIRDRLDSIEHARTDGNSSNGPNVK
jgi:hypothetical protein